MDWIKKNSEKFTLLLLSVALIAAAVVLVLNAQKLLAVFEPLKAKPVESSKMPPLDTEQLKAAQEAAEKPVTWTHDEKSEGILFASELYSWDPKEGSQAGDINTIPGGMIHPPVPNDWITGNHLDLSDSNVLKEDPDGDGFNNLEEWTAHTDPNDKNSHPEYTTKLFLAKFIQKPFRLKFNGKPDPNTYEINTIDYNQPTQFLQMGDLIPNTKYKIVDYKEIHKKDANEIDQDLSELTIENTETGKKLVLVVGVQGNDPDSFAQFTYFWKKPPASFPVKLDATFTLDPETDVTYKLIDIKADQATIENQKTNKQIVIPLFKQGGDTFHYPDKHDYSLTIKLAKKFGQVSQLVPQARRKISGTESIFR